MKPLGGFLIDKDPKPQEFCGKGFIALKVLFLTVRNVEKGREEMCTLVEDYAKDAVKEVARKMLQTGADVAYVIKCTGLSQEDVLEIKEEENL